MKKVEVVVPVYNEEEILERNIATLCAFLTRNMGRHDWHITIADNASSDLTPQKGEALARRYARVDYSFTEAKGRGGALRRVWLASDADILCYMDADLSTDLEALPRLIDGVASGGDLVVGSRLMAGAQVQRCLSREVLSRGYNRLIRLWLGSRCFTDAQCGFKAIRRQVAHQLLAQVESNEWFFDTELLVRAEWAGCRIREIPVRWVEEPDSRVEILTAIGEDLAGLWRLRRQRPRRPRRVG